ncbi:lasso peptide biosynthesis PqqD family chaperone [Peribacillus loiseleuriae]|uniref:Metallophosphoesterase n=1 Tax=Peribacillus loiseleuriae TaxID=1679170 RepID=A0A0K9GZ49_9BACI|nr:lasso peptide biosynthesis PqqD family chaperone [Peribacillus loiseleuriae]KMY51875.1 metallophosphoesterase [Peribacillus loiseleuriae]
MNQIEIISINQMVSQGQGNIVSDMDGEKVMLSIQNGKYYNLGEMGGEIWELMKEPISIQSLVSTLCSIYDVDQTVCEEQVIAFIAKLQDEDLIQMEDMDRS